VADHEILVDEGLELLTEADARALLATADVGRVGVTIAALPAIFPVNYGIVDDCIVFRTAPGSKLSAAASGAVVAFEVDDYDRAERSGWSVLVVGPSEIVHDLELTFKILDAAIEPWAGGIRTNIVRIRPELISGRRIA
jgi:nitroimidazol reductase NimA-like FMN-containing flavoprotein (pyridoxamine 5'-phosphate oxidase superfamily)